MYQDKEKEIKKYYCPKCGRELQWGCVQLVCVWCGWEEKQIDEVEEIE